MRELIWEGEPGVPARGRPAGTLRRSGCRRRLFPAPGGGGGAAKRTAAADAARVSTPGGAGGAGAQGPDWRFDDWGRPFSDTKDFHFTSEEMVLFLFWS